MNDKELQEIERMASRYGDPIRGKLLAMKSYIEQQDQEIARLIEIGSRWENGYLHLEDEIERLNAVSKNLIEGWNSWSLEEVLKEVRSDCDCLVFFPVYCNKCAIISKALGEVRGE
jgi:hypothetical protein